MDIHAVDLNLLVALDALLAERNVTRAAARVGLSQSAMSAALARLRQTFGDPLLLRTARGMLPTTRGRDLAAPTKQVLAEIGRLIAPAGTFDPASARQTFVIAASDYVEYAILPQLVDHLECNAPASRLAVRASDLASIGRQLESGEVDLAVINPRHAPPEVHSRPLYLERFMCVVRAGHPRVGATIVLDEFCALKHVMVSPRGGSFSTQIDDVLATLGRNRDVRLSVPHFLLVPEIISRSEMIAVLPERLARGYAGRLKVIELPFEIAPFTIAAIWHERTHRDPAQAWLREALANLMHADELPLPSRRIHEPMQLPSALPKRARRAGKR